MTDLRIYENTGRRTLGFLAALLAKRVLAAELRALVVVRTKQLACELNDQLWTGRKISFLPHCLASDANAAQTPVVIADAANLPQEPPLRDVLITLGDIGCDHAASYRSYVAILPRQLSEAQELTQLVEDLKAKGHRCKVFDRAPAAAGH